MTLSEKVELEKWIELIWEKAQEMGLNPYPTHFEVVPDYIIYELGSYGLPGRFSHWTFGRDYHKQKSSYDYGFSKIYEIVFNSNPTQAFLLDSNSMLSHKFVVAHVLGHSDFFRRNTYFQHTDRDMIQKCQLFAKRIYEYEKEYGIEEVESFLDWVLSIEYNFDHESVIFKPYIENKEKEKEKETEYDDIWNAANGPKPIPEKIKKKIPPIPDSDLLIFLRDHTRDLEDWQRDIINIVREEMVYFLPQMKTKTLNEGFASVSHESIMTEMPLTPAEHLEFRRIHSSVLSPGSKMSLNPYYIGYKILKDIERRWNGESGDIEETNWLGDVITRPAGGDGRKKMFEVVEEECDTTFFRKYLTEELIQKLDLYTYVKEEMKDGSINWVVKDTNWKDVRDEIVNSMTNFGQPIVKVEDGNYNFAGELYLKHYYDGKELDEDYTARTLKSIYKIWGRPVHIETIRNDEICTMKYPEE